MKGAGLKIVNIFLFFAFFKHAIVVSAACSNWVRKIIITLGKKGAAVFENNNLFYSHGKNFGKAIDTTGAGDCFNGALASQLALGKEIKEAVDFACSAAALSVLKKGTAESMPSLSMIKKFTSPKSN